MKQMATRRNTRWETLGRVVTMLAGIGVTWISAAAIIATFHRWDGPLFLLGLALLAMGYALVRMAWHGTAQ